MFLKLNPLLILGDNVRMLIFEALINSGMSQQKLIILCAVFGGNFFFRFDLEWPDVSLLCIARFGDD